MQNNYQQLELIAADVVEGYYLEGQESLFSLVSPEATENLVINPSPVIATTGYTAMAGTLTSSTTRQRRGPNSIRYAPTNAVNDGAYFATVTTVTGWNTFSLDFWGFPGVPYQIYFATTAPALLGTATTFVGEGMWRRPEVKFYEAAGTTRRLYFTKNNSTDTNYFYVDGLQVEAKDHSTTYADGSMVGFVPGQIAYYWTGAYYGSTSIRIADTGSGGRVIPLSNYNFRLLGHTGLGMATANPIAFPYARIDGENYQTTRMSGRDFSLMGSVTGQTPSELMQNKSALVDAFHPNRTPTRQPLLLLYQYADEFGNNLSEDIYKIQCYYVDGLKGTTTNKYQERLGLNFRMSQPDMVLDGIFGAGLNYQTSVANTAFAAARINGVWQALGTGFNGAVFQSQPDPVRGRVWFCGTFTTANGVTVNKFTYWDIALQTFVAVGGATKGVGTDPYGMVVAANGDVWVFGYFLTAGGAATKGVARWNNASDTFTVFNLAATFNSFRAGCLDSAGNFYLGGNFQDWNGDAAQDYIIKYTVAAVWEAVGAQPFTANEYIFGPRCMAVDSNDNLYIGSYAAVGGVPAHIRKWNKTTLVWSDLGATNNGAYFNTLVFGADSNLYIGGYYTSIAGITLQKICRYNMSTFLPMGIGFPDGFLPSAVWSLTVDNNNFVWVKGRFYLRDTSGTDWSFCAVWNGSIWTDADIVTPENTGGSSSSLSILNNNLYISWGSESSTTSLASGVTTVTSSTKDGDLPNIVITGPTTAGTNCILHWLEDYTTGKRLFFYLSIAYGEKVTISLNFNTVSVVSSSRGSIFSQPLSGSDSTSFRLALGDNKILTFITGTLTGVAAAMTWNKVKHSLG